jgi:hypothetical protein
MCYLKSSTSFSRRKLALRRTLMNISPGFALSGQDSANAKVVEKLLASDARSFISCRDLENGCENSPAMPGKAPCERRAAGKGTMIRPARFLPCALQPFSSSTALQGRSGCAYRYPGAGPFRAAWSRFKSFQPEPSTSSSRSRMYACKATYVSLRPPRALRRARRSSEIPLSAIVVKSAGKKERARGRSLDGRYPAAAFRPLKRSMEF